MRRTLPLVVTTALTCVAASAALLAPAHGVRNGSDGVAHPMVGLMAAHDGDGNALWDCSGTLVSPTVFVTAGHCTSADTVDGDGRPESVAHIELWFGDGPYETNAEFLQDVGSGDDPSCIVDGTSDERHPGFPCTGELTGTAHTHPDYDPAQFWLHDLGVVVLEEGVGGPGFRYATLPGADDFDGWASDRKQTFDAVGYGKQTDYGQGASWKYQGDIERKVAHPTLVSINAPSVGDYAMRLSGNARTGGTCSGDSGGPNFLAGTLVIAGVTSYGVNDQTCSGPDGAYRLDGADDVAFLDDYVAYPAP